MTLIPSEINTELNNLQSSKTAIKNAIESKGVTIETDTPFSEYADLIEDNLTLTPTDTLNIVTNDTYDVTNYVSAVVNVPTDDVSYSAWDDKILKSCEDNTVDTTKYYQINCTGTYPFQTWNKANFPNVREIRQWSGNSVLGYSGIDYGTIDFSKLEKATGIGSYFLSNQNNKAINFPKLVSFNSSNYAFSSLTNCTLSFPELVSINSTYSFTNSSGTITFDKVTSLESHSFSQRSNENLTIYINTVGSAVNLGSYNMNPNTTGTFTINIPNADTIGFTWYQNKSDAQLSTFTISAPNVRTLNWGNYMFYSIGVNTLAKWQPLLNQVTTFIGGYLFYSINSAITEITLSNAVDLSQLRYMLSNSNSVTKVYLPKCTTLGQYTFNGSALTEIHFGADNQAAIEANTYYSTLWGRGAGNATVYFDL